MSTKKQGSAPEPDPRHERELWLIDKARRLSAEDDFAGALRALDDYPRLTRHSLTEFERDMRDWGLVYGITFGLAIAKWPNEPHDELASLAFEVSRMVYVRWGGEIQDPELRREAALRAVVERYDRWDDERYARSYRPAEVPMGDSMSNALHELREAVA
jgi:hypothetical protein